MKTATAYDAFWFLMEHPKMQCRAARLLSAEEVGTFVPGRGERVRVVKDAMPWNQGVTYKLHEYAFRMKALETNLHIFYSLVNERRGIDDDAAKNVNIECSLEFGQIRQAVSDGRLRIDLVHDIRLDCGAPTFDEALVKLAGKVRKYYGDIPAPRWMAGKPKNRRNKVSAIY